MEKKVRYKAPEISFLIKEALSRYTALPSLYEWQEKAVKAALSGKNTLLVMPPNVRVFMCCILPMIISKKKSIIYAETEDFLKNQISLLKKLGVPYISLENNQLPGKQSNIINEISGGLYKIILCNDTDVLNSLISSSIPLDICAVETYNGISGDIRSLVKLFRKKSVPVIFYTSNPSPEICEDIVECARIAGRDILVRDFDKPNLSFMIMKGEDKPEKIVNIISKVRGQGIIFADSAEDAQKISGYLKGEDIDCGEYISDDSVVEKSAADFSNGTLRVLITNSVMYKKVKNPGIRYVIHYSLPLSLTDYYRESRIAGLDGSKSYCILLYNPRDRQKSEEMIRKRYPEKHSKEKSRAFACLEIMVDYIFSNVCRKNYILTYFGDTEVKDRCGMCDVCVGQKKEIMLRKYDVSIIKTIIKCIAELREKFGINTIVDVLRGKEGKKIQQFNLKNASTFGALKDLDNKVLKETVNNLILDGYISVKRGIYRTLELTHWGKNVIKEEEIFEIRLPKFINVKAGDSFDPVLFEELRLTRRKIARRMHLPTFQVFLDRVLQDLATLQPEDEEAMSKIKGVGKIKMELFGKKFVETIVEYKKKKQKLE